MAKDKKPEQTIDRYIAGLPPDVAFIMEQIRETMHAVAPDVRESVKYTMPLFQYDGAYLYVGAWKKHIASTRSTRPTRSWKPRLRPIAPRRTRCSSNTPSPCLMT